MNTYTRLCFIIARVFKDDGMTLSLIISSWVVNQHLQKTPVNGGSLVEFKVNHFYVEGKLGQLFREIVVYMLPLPMIVL